MTINQAISLLTALQTRHRDGNPTTEIDVYFDCPHCGTAFSPDKVVAEAVRPAVVLK